MRLSPLLVCLIFATACQGGAPSGSSASSAEPSAAPAPTTSAAPTATQAAAPPTATAVADASTDPPDGSATDAADVGSGDAGSGDGGATMADPGRLTLDGRAIQGGLIRAKLNGKLKSMKFPGHRAIVSDEGEFLIAFSRNAPAKETMTITFDDGQVLEKVFEIEKRTFETDKIDNLPDNVVKLDAKTKKELAKADTKLDALRSKYTKKNCYKDGFVWPTKGKLTSRYGQPRILNGIDSGIHWGIDISAPVGTPVRAPACGTVIFAEKNLPLSGDTLVIDHGHGLTSTFIHLHDFTAKVGTEVKQGQVVAHVGMTGRTTGAHLDWRMNYFEIRIDPELLVPPMNK
ncbi:MAG TPA: M23 family metallopeptidase [Polyangiaceae bacterium]|nr:M23 family metallopeptidase [Polyangiaceae bacterium]